MHALPAAAREANEKRQKVEELIEQMVAMECLPEHIQAQRDRLAKMPKKVEEEVQPLVDMTHIARTQLSLKTHFTKLDAECDMRETKFDEEKRARDEELQRDLKAADDEHQLRLKAIWEQHRIHSEAAEKKRADNAERKEKLKVAYESKLKEVQEGFAAVGVGAEVPAADSTPVPVQQVAFVTPVVTPHQVNTDQVQREMLSKPGLEGLTQEQAGAMTNFFLEYLRGVAVTAAVAPSLAGGASVPVQRKSNGARASAAVPGVAETDAEAPMHVDLASQDAEHDALDQAGGRQSKLQKLA